MAQLIGANNTQSTLVPNNDGMFTLQELQGVVKGYIEIIALPDGNVMVMNEEGKLRQLPYNRIATEKARGVIGFDDFISGDVVICTRKEAGYDE